jgi:hypothetical protein
MGNADTKFANEKENRQTCINLSMNINNSCNQSPDCYYMNSKCSYINTFTKLDDISSTDLICSIYPNPEGGGSKYVLTCKNNNNNKNIVIQSILIGNNSNVCTNSFSNDCNLLLSNTIDSTFTLKSFMNTFDNNGYFTNPILITNEQKDLIVENNKKITLIDIFNTYKTISASVSDINSATSNNLSGTNQKILLETNYYIRDTVIQSTK